jgi:peptide-methionine (R)-S-oxide reductase
MRNQRFGSASRGLPGVLALGQRAASLAGLVGLAGLVACAGCDARSSPGPSPVADSTPTATKNPTTSNSTTSTSTTPALTPNQKQEFAGMREMRPKAVQRPATLDGEAQVKPVELTDERWRAKLSKDEFYVLRQKGTERAFTGEYWRTKPPAEQAKDQSVYSCRACGLELFRGDSKFDSGCGWPSFDRMIQRGTVKEVLDTSHGWVRTEVVCARCEGHLGHLFDDGPTETGLRYCINSVSIIKRDATEADKPK